LSTLHKSGASSSGLPPTRRNIEDETAAAFSALVTLLPSQFVTIPPVPNCLHIPNHALLAKSLEFQASLVADIIYARNFNDPKIWNRCVATYAGPWLGAEDSFKFSETVREHFLAIDQVFCSHM
jgi:elongation factor 3